MACWTKALASAMSMLSKPSVAPGTIGGVLDAVDARGLAEEEELDEGAMTELAPGPGASASSPWGFG